MPIASAGLVFVLFVYLLVFCANLLMSFAWLAVTIKRLHDRDKSAWWLLLFDLVPLIPLKIAYYTRPVEVRLILVLESLSIAIWFLVELGFLRRTAGPNRYGADPRIHLTGSVGAGIADQGAGHGGRAAARFATIALLTLTGAVFVAELVLPVVLVQHGPWSRVLSALSPRMPAAPNEAQRRLPAAPNGAQGQPRPPAAPNEAQRQPQPPAAPNAAAESGVTGVWTAYNVGFPPWTLTLKAVGTKLSGTVQQGVRRSSGSTTLTMPAAIYDGEIDGNKITFKCQDPWSHDRTITFTGILNRDEITFTRTVLVKPGGSRGSNGIFGASSAAEFTAQRVRAVRRGIGTGGAGSATRGPRGSSLCQHRHQRRRQQRIGLATETAARSRNIRWDSVYHSLGRSLSHPYAQPCSPRLPEHAPVSYWRGVRCAGAPVVVRRLDFRSRAARRNSADLLQ